MRHLVFCQTPERRPDSTVKLVLLLLSTLLSASTAESRRLEAAPPLAAPNYTAYHARTQVFQSVAALVQQNPSSFKVEELHAQEGNYSSTLQVVTVEPGGLSTQHEHKIRLLLVMPPDDHLELSSNQSRHQSSVLEQAYSDSQDFGEHGRELITVEVALKLLELLSDPLRLRRAVDARGGNLQKLEDLLHHSVFKIIPVENVHGREIVEDGRLCERKNGRGVDSNRNWPVHWGFREKDYDPSEEYPGLKPFSEPEVQMLNNIAEGFKPHIWMNMHSGMEALFMPYDHLAALPDDEAGRVSFELLQALDALKCKRRCAIGSGGKSVGYLAHGTATDYMHDVLGVPFSFTWEIYGDLAANFHDCFRMFNPLSEKEMHQVSDNWADAVLAMLELLPSSSSALRTRQTFWPRKVLPRALSKVVEEAYNRTDTDLAAAARQRRLDSLFDIVASVEHAHGLSPGSERWDALSDIPLAAWFAAMCFAGVALGLLLRRTVCRELGTKLKPRASRRKHDAVL